LDQGRGSSLAAAIPELRPTRATPLLGDVDRNPTIRSGRSCTRRLQTSGPLFPTYGIYRLGECKLISAFPEARVRRVLIRISSLSSLIPVSLTIVMLSTAKACTKGEPGVFDPSAPLTRSPFLRGSSALRPRSFR